MSKEKKHMLEIEKRDRVHGHKTIDDLQILLDLYRFRALTAQQLRTLHFAGRKTYVYRKMQFLKRGGMILSKSIVRGGKKAEAAYYLTQKGINTLKEHDILDSPRHSYRNIPDWRRIDDILDENELYVQLQGTGAEVLEKREWKKTLQLNRTSYLAGGLRFLGKDYHVYMINNESTIETLERIHREIMSEKQLSRYILIFKGIEAMTKYRAMFHEEKGKLEMLQLPYLFIPLRMGFLVQGSPVTQYFTNEKGETLIPLSETLDTLSTFADYEVTMDGEEYFVSDMLWNDIIKYHKVIEYQQSGYERHQRKVYVICWQEKQKEYQAQVDERIIKVIGIQEQDLSFHSFYPTFQERIQEKDFRAPEKRKKCSVPKVN